MDMILEWSTRIIGALIVLGIGWFIGGWLSNRVQHLKKLDDTLRSFLGGLVKYGVFAIAVVTVIGLLGIPMASLLALLGAAGLAIGLALQGTLSNVAAGVMLLILRPFNVGDYIEFGATAGTVKSLSLFGTELATVDNKYVFAPNSTVWGGEIINYSRNKHRRQDIIVGISYGDDINKAIKTITKVLGKEARLITSTDKEPIIVVNNMGESSVDLMVRVWSTGGDYFPVKWDLTKAIKEALDKDGITIPFPTRTIEIVGGDEDIAA